MRLYCVKFDRESLINYRRGLIAFSRCDLAARRDYDFRYIQVGTPKARMRLWMRDDDALSFSPTAIESADVALNRINLAIEI